VSVAPTLDPALQLALRGAAALLFGSAATHKLRDPAGFRDALGAYALLPEATLAPSVAALIAAEAAITIGCLLPASAAAACLAGALLLALYSAAIGINLVRGRRAIDCGCGGPGGSRPLRADLVARNGGVAALLCVAALAPGPRTLVWIDAATVAGAIAMLALLYAAIDVAAANAARLHSEDAPAWAPR
jgi:hypothetical protein